MPLPWVRLDTNLPSHDKILELLEDYPGPAGRSTGFVFVCGMSYAGHNQTDGLIPFGALPLIHGTKKDAERLVAVDLWKPHPRGWEMPNWLDRQQSSGSTERVAKAMKAGSRKGNCIRWHGVNCGCWTEGITE